ncbi:unnamed protein product [Symbiodinium natans]|uniref:Uncharacterized protein n=1 Tax=Symbiodinium natans TaxID=878477 RepID=A0A812PDX4_9DINO|nr:unnamed protein product [Symbiodinium natans]
MGLLAALLPVPEESLRQEVLAACAQRSPSSVAAAELGQVLSGLGIESSNPKQKALRQRYSITRRAHWRLRWLLLKAVGAVGSGCTCGLAGVAGGAFIGSCLAIPSRVMPDFQIGDTELIRALKSGYFVVLLLYYGVQRWDLVALGLKIGAGLGVCYGFWQGLVIVDPEDHGLRSVFYEGLRTSFSAMSASTCTHTSEGVAWPGSTDEDL